MTPDDAKSQLRRCWARLHLAVVDLKDIRETCPWLGFEEKLRFSNIIGAARKAESLASYQLDEWEEEDAED